MTGDNGDKNIYNTYINCLNIDRTFAVYFFLSLYSELNIMVFMSEAREGTRCLQTSAVRCLSVTEFPLKTDSSLTATYCV